MGFLDLELSDADLVEPDSQPSTPRPGERVNQLFESIFGRMGPPSVANGWSCFPQERGERRRPAQVDRATLRFKPFQTRLPTPAEVRSWSLQCPGENVAIVTGEASGFLWALDVDCDDVVLSNAVRALANEHLGETPFLRFGRFPRVVMLYRHAADVALRKRTFCLAGRREDGTLTDSGDAIEILANGSPFTAYGIHHKTGNYFKWAGPQPFLSRPDLAPLVIPEQIGSFLAAVREVRPFFRASSSVGTSANGAPLDLDAPLDFEVRDFGVVPHGIMSDGAWVVEDGRVTDGRELYLRELARRVVCANAAAFDYVERAAGDEATRKRGEPTAAERLATWALHHACEVCAHGKRDAASVKRDLADKLRRAEEKFNERGVDGRRQLAPISTQARAEGRAVAHRALTTVFARDEALSWLGARSAASGLVEREVDVEAKGARGVRVKCLGVDAATSEKAVARALGGDRSAMHDRVQGVNGTSLDAWLGDVALVGPPVTEGPRVLPPYRVHLNLGPTGAGKSTLAVRRVSELVAAEKASGQPYAGPLVFSPPSHANISELVVKGRDAGMRFHDDEVNDGVVDYNEMGLQALTDHAVSLGLNALHLKSKLLTAAPRKTGSGP